MSSEGDTSADRTGSWVLSVHHETTGMSETSPDEPIVFPMPGRLRLLVIYGLVAVVLLAVALLISGNLGHALIAGDIVLVVSCLGIARSGIRCDGNGVAVQGLTHWTHRFTWAEIVKFENRKFHGIGVVRQEDGWNPLVGPKMFGRLSEDTTEQLEQQRRLRQSA